VGDDVDGFAEAAGVGVPPVLAVDDALGAEPGQRSCHRAWRETEMLGHPPGAGPGQPAAVLWPGVENDVLEDRPCGWSEAPYKGAGFDRDNDR
jgi:hypothetical protein